MTKTVLIVDDNAYIRRALYELFAREADFAVCGQAEDGKQAIEKAVELRPDLIVLDLSMPVMNGVDAARELKRLLPSVALIMYSAFGDILPKQEARRAGVSQVVSKSESGVTLVSTARRLLFPDAA